MRKSKIKHSKAQFNLQFTIYILALTSGNVGKYELLTGEEVLPEKRLRKSSGDQNTEYSSLGSELKKRRI